MSSIGSSAAVRVLLSAADPVDDHSPFSVVDQIDDPPSTHTNSVDLPPELDDAVWTRIACQAAYPLLEPTPIGFSDTGEVSLGLSVELQSVLISRLQGGLPGTG